MLRAFLAILLLGATAPPAPVPSRSISVTVVNRPIDATAIVDHGRVLLPMRAAFEALYSTVSYDPAGRLVTARNILHVLRLRLDSRATLLDGRPATLDTPPHLINGRVYVPLRFAAQAMGAIIRYNPRTRLIAINGSDETAKPASDVAHAPQDLNPPPNSSVDTAYPVVSASLGASYVASNAATMTIDGTNVTTQAAFDGRTMTYVPHEGLAPGRHTAAFAARTATGLLFSTQWSFVTSAPPMDAPAVGVAPQFFAFPGQQFAGGSWMNLTMVGPPNGSGFVQICNPSFIFPLQNVGSGFFRARIALPQFVITGGCPINAVFIDGSGRHFVITPMSNGLYLTGNPLNPFGQFQAGPTIVPVLPFIH